MRGTTLRPAEHAVRLGISIHAPLAGNDTILSALAEKSSHFNPRSPCGERHTATGRQSLSSHFNPRSPCGERLTPFNKNHVSKNFNPRSPCGERQALSTSTTRGLPISIHAPLAGNDRCCRPTCPIRWTFQSTLPLRGTTSKAKECVIAMEFQSTLPLRGTTHHVRRHQARRKISIHAPLAGNDRSAPARGHRQLFQSTLPLRGTTRSEERLHAAAVDFNPRSPCGERRMATQSCWARFNFNPRSPCGERLHKWTSKVHRMRQYLIHALESISSSPHIHFKMTCNQVLYFCIYFSYPLFGFQTCF